MNTLPYTELIKQLAEARQRQSIIRDELATARAEWETQWKPLLDEERAASERIAVLEAEIRTQGAQYATAFNTAPCPGTKLHRERVVRYVAVTNDGEIVPMDTARIRASVCEHIITHGWTSMLKPDVSTWEKAVKGIPDEERPDWVRVDWQTTVSIDRDLEPALAAIAEEEAT